MARQTGRDAKGNFIDPSVRRGSNMIQDLEKYVQHMKLCKPSPENP